MTVLSLTLRKHAHAICSNTVVELSFRKGRVQTVIMRALCTRFVAARAYEAFFSSSKGHFNIGPFGPVSFTGTICIFLMLKVL